MSIPPPAGTPQPQDPLGQYPAAEPQGPYVPPQFPYGGGPGQAPYGLYGPYGPRPPAAVNGVAVAALVFGVLCFLPAVGLVLGLIALRQIARRRERGRGMAVAGALLSSAGLALWTVSLATGFAGDVRAKVEKATRGDAITALRKGDCFDSPGGLAGSAATADRVPCAGEHDGEVFALVTLPEGPFPGDGGLTGIADDRCYALQETYAMDGWALPDHLDVYYLVPSRGSWRFGDREITCVFGNEDARAGLTGSLRRDETTLNPHQLAYLKAARVLDTALDGAPGAEAVEDDLPGHKEWAGQVSEALAEQAGMLREHTWPADAEGPVTELVSVLEKAGAEWARAAGADGVDTFYEHYARGWGLIDPHRSVTARKALGLATSPPAYEEEPGGGGDTGGMEV
ncbi:DUF4190 domain-containing protein [Streptomyces sp. NPDC005931]|uniref:DUF4190 domain-containing protein n=1 Tax=Streptomyces sp. NPDC005931 TaxID=3364737 RepID=UPI0036BD7E2D